jgi:PhzF family phenazine biosynthesis protein
MKLAFTQVDAFADRPFGGNPAAVMPLDAWLDDAVLLAIARENNLSETAFTVPSPSADAEFELRWFTPGQEVALCGHATLAAGHVLIGARPMVRFRTRKAGVLTVARDGDAYALELPAIAVAPAAVPAVSAALGTGAAPAFMSTDDAAEPAVIVLLDSEAQVRAVAPDFKALSETGVMAIVTAPGAGTAIASRVFVPYCGIDEDPVTGSAHAALVPFWAARLGQTRFDAVQASARGGRLGCRVSGDRVTLAGRCVTVIEGSFFL